MWEKQQQTSSTIPEPAVSFQHVAMIHLQYRKCSFSHVFTIRPTHFSQGDNHGLNSHCCRPFRRLHSDHSEGWKTEWLKRQTCTLLYFCQKPPQSTHYLLHSYCKQCAILWIRWMTSLCRHLSPKYFFLQSIQLHKSFKSTIESFILRYKFGNRKPWHVTVISPTADCTVSGLIHANDWWRFRFRQVILTESGCQGFFVEFLTPYQGILLLKDVNKSSFIYLVFVWFVIHLQFQLLQFDGVILPVV